MHLKFDTGPEFGVIVATPTQRPARPASGSIGAAASFWLAAKQQIIATTKYVATRQGRRMTMNSLTKLRGGRRPPVRLPPSVRFEKFRAEDRAPPRSAAQPALA
jgi:hypothetical protein